MTKMIRKKFMAVILTLAMVLSLVPALTIMASAAAPPNENYNDNHGFTSTASEIILDGIKYTLTRVTGTPYTEVINQGAPDGSALGDDNEDYYIFISADTVKIEAQDRSNFRLNGFAMDIHAEGDVTISPSSGTHLTYHSNGSIIVVDPVDVSGNTDFENITSVTFSGTGLCLSLDDLDFEDAVPSITISSATYNASTNVLAVTGTGMTIGDAIDVTKLTLTGEGGNTYTLTSANVTASSATSFSVTLNEADALNVAGLLNKDGTSSANSTTYNLAGAAGWDATQSAPADLTGNGITVSNVQTPAITSATYDAAAGVLAVTGTNMVKQFGATNDIDVSKLMLTGEGGATYTLTDSADVALTSGTAFSVTLSDTDKAGVNQILNKIGISSTGSTTYNLAAADDWNGPITGVSIADTTGNGITVSIVPVPTITSAAYNAGTGTLVVNGTGFSTLNGAANDIDVLKLTLTGEGGALYTLTSSGVEITSGTAFAVTLSAADKAAVNQILNKLGTSSTGGMPYNLAAAEDWAAGADTAVVVADLTDNGITVSSVPVPTITSAGYNAGTGTLVVTGAGFLKLNGATNDIDVSMLMLTGEGGVHYTLTDSGNVELTSSTAFSVTLSDTDKAAVNQILNKYGTSSTGGTTYNLAAAEDWAAGADAVVDVADLTGNGIAVNVALPTAATSAASSVTSTAATLNGTVNANNDSTTVTFEYGTDTAYGSTVTATPSPAAGTSATTVSSALTGLTPDTTYHYRVIAVNSAGTTNGSDMTFSTDITPPTIFGAAKNSNTQITVTLSEACQNLAKANDGGFTVTKTGMATTYAVSATAQGTGSSHVVLTVADMGTAGASGVTVTYTAGVNGTIADTAGNALATDGTGQTIAAWDTDAPTATIVVADTTLAVGETSLVTITFSEAVTGFANADLTVANGTLSNVSSSDGGITWTATFTPTASITDASNLITLDNTGIQDAAGNSGTGITVSSNYVVDTLRPMATIVVANPALKAGETSLVTITFSEAVTGFTSADLAIANGSLTPVSSSDGGITWTATFTPTASVTAATNVITLDNTGVADAAGNSGSGTTNSNIYAIDTLRPTATIVMVDNALAVGETSLVTITFSEAVTGFTNADLTVANGTLSSVSSSDGGVTWTATFTPTASITAASNVITLDNTGIQNAAGNSGTGTTDSNNYAVDTLRPTATIVLADTALNAGETSLVTITFSEAVTGFTNADLTVANGTLSSVSSSDGGVTWTATFTPTASATAATNVITLDNTGVLDAAGNSGSGTTDSGNYSVGTAIPTVSGVSAPSDATYVTGQNLNYTVSFSEAVTVITTGGTPYLTLTIGTSAVHAVYVSGTGTTSLVFRYTVGSNDADANGIALSSNITLNGGTMKDAAGNDATLAFTGSTAVGVLVDAVAPTVTGVAGPSAGTYTAGDNLTFTATFSEAVTVIGTPYIVLTIGGVAVNAAYVSGTGTTSITFQYTALSGDLDTDGIACAAEITLPVGAAVRDAAGNGSALTYAAPTTAAVLVDAVAPTISDAIRNSDTQITVTLSEACQNLAKANDGGFTVTKTGTATTYAVGATAQGTDSSHVVLTVANMGTAGSSGVTVTYATGGNGTIDDMAGNELATNSTGKAITAWASSGGGSSSGSSSTNSAAVIVNGVSKTAGTAQTTTNSSGQSVTTVTVDSNKLENILASESTGATVTIPITGNSNVAVGTLTGTMVKSMENKDATLVVQTSSGTYTLPASEINIDAVSQQLGANVSLSDIKVTVSISEPSASMTRVAENAAQAGGFTIMIPAVDYTITCTHGSQTVNVSRFNAYVERTIAIPDGIDPTKITTGVVVDPDGTVHHVPTRIAVISGKYYAVINSLTNSTYSVVWNPIEFSDVANHWAKDAINNMGSKMVVAGVGNNHYAPNRNMTRAEFATIMVRALGLEPGTGASGFGDVASTDWCSGYIKTAASYGIVGGYDNGNFGPKDTITREQAMTMIARAMRITGLDNGLTDSEVSALLGAYKDVASASNYAKASIAVCLKTGITSGTGNATISPKAAISRAEVAVMVQRLLQKSGLI